MESNCRILPLQLAQTCTRSQQAPPIAFTLLSLAALFVPATSEDRHDRPKARLLQSASTPRRATFDDAILLPGLFTSAFMDDPVFDYMVRPGKRRAVLESVRRFPSLSMQQLQRYAIVDRELLQLLALEAMHDAGAAKILHRSLAAP